MRLGENEHMSSNGTVALIDPGFASLELQANESSGHISRAQSQLELRTYE